MTGRLKSLRYHSTTAQIHLLSVNLTACPALEKFYFLNSIFHFVSLLNILVVGAPRNDVDQHGSLHSSINNIDVKSNQSSSSCHAASTDIPDLLSSSPYHSSPLAGLPGNIPYSHIAAVCMFELVVLLLLGHMRGSIGVHLLWARP